jgi:hypothetical protein
MPRCHQATGPCILPENDSHDGQPRQIALQQLVNRGVRRSRVAEDNAARLVPFACSARCRMNKCLDTPNAVGKRLTCWPSRHIVCSADAGMRTFTTPAVERGQTFPTLLEYPPSCLFLQNTSLNTSVRPPAAVITTTISFTS